MSVSIENFLGFGFTSESVLSFYWLQSNDDNGADEWVLSSEGEFLEGPIDPVAPVPLPAGFPLLLAGLGAFGFVARRRRN